MIPSTLKPGKKEVTLKAMKTFTLKGEKREVTLKATIKTFHPHILLKKSLVGQVTIASQFPLLATFLIKSTISFL